MVGDTGKYSAVSELVTTRGARGGAGGLLRTKREYVNLMRIVGLHVELLARRSRSHSRSPERGGDNGGNNNGNAPPHPRRQQRPSAGR